MGVNDGVFVGRVVLEAVGLGPGVFVMVAVRVIVGVLVFVGAGVSV